MLTAKDFFEELRFQFEKNLPFVAYRHPSVATEISPAVKAFLQKDTQLHKIRDYSESGFIFAPFDATKEAILIPAESSNFLKTVFEIQPFEIERSDQNRSEEDGKAKEKHQKIINNALNEIERGIFKKVVLSRKEIIETKDHDVLKIFGELLQKYPSAFVYIWFHPKIGLWLGATPETLLKVERGQFYTMALAGTQRIQDQGEISWGDKEKEEQQIVVDSIHDSLEKASVRNIKTSDAYTTKAGTLLHLKTDISGQVSNENNGLQNLITAIHPTPAVCGLPKEAAKVFILENENYDREFYTGFLGEINLKTERKRSSNRRNQENQAYGSISNTTALYVNLRCMKLEGNKAILFVGGGITRDSDPEAEWEETKNKAETMKAVLHK